MQDKFRILMCSDVDYEEMVVDVIYENRTLATISQENGIDNMEIKIFPPHKDDKSWKLPFDDFVEVIALAKKYLIEDQKLPED